jgi:hypothetical protein
MTLFAGVLGDRAEGVVRVARDRLLVGFGVYLRTSSREPEAGCLARIAQIAAARTKGKAYHINAARASSLQAIQNRLWRRRSVLLASQSSPTVISCGTRL